MDMTKSWIKQYRQSIRIIFINTKLKKILNQSCLKKNADLSHLQRLRQFLDTFHSQEGSNPFIRAENRS